MALIKCPECNKEISSNANSCPNCGYAIKSNKKKGQELKEGLKGLNTVASPKKKKTCLILCQIPILAFIFAVIGGINNNDVFIGIFVLLYFLSGALFFYTGHFKKGIIYTLTCGGFFVGTLIAEFKLLTGTFRDSSGFPVIY